MAKRWCLHCGSPLHVAGILGTMTAYCPACGWNKAVAQKNLRFELRFTGAAFLIAEIFLVYRTLQDPRGAGFYFASTILTGVAALVFLLVLRHQSARLAVAGVATSAPSKEEEQSGIDEELDFSSFFARLQSMPIPRRLRLIGMGKAMVFLYVMLSLISLGVSTSEASAPGGNPAVPLLVLAVVLLIAGFLLWKRHVHRRLMRDGALAEGRVTWMEEGSRDWNALGYTFRDAAQKTVEGTGKDRTGELCAGSPVIVFYDPEDSNKNLAHGCSFYELKLPRSFWRNAS